VAQPHPSLAGRAALAVLLMFGFYVLAAGVVLALVYLPYAEWHYADRLDLRLLVFSLVGALAVLSGVAPRFDRFRAPGPRLARQEQPRLFEIVDQIAKATDQRTPRDVFLVPELNAWVAQRGGIVGIGSRRVMGLGLPLLEALRISELRAVIAHEFGHFHGGDTALGPWLYRTRGAIERTVANLTGRHSWVRAPFVWYGNAFLRITHAISRRQELAADGLAARVAGARALASGLKRIHASALLFHSFWTGEVAPALNSGFHPPIGPGFAQFLAGADSRGQTEKILAQELASRKTNPYDTHPPLNDRLAALQTDDQEVADPHDAAAVTLLERTDDLEAQLVHSIMTEAGARNLRPTTWEELSTAFWVPQWELLVRSFQDRLQGLTPSSLAVFAHHPAKPAIHLQLTPDMAHANANHVAKAQAVLGAALTVLLHHRGWQVQAPPGQEVRCSCGSLEMRPFTLLTDLLGGSVSSDAWQATWSATGAAGEDLGVFAASLKPPQWASS